MIFCEVQPTVDGKFAILVRLYLGINRSYSSCDVEENVPVIHPWRHKEVGILRIFPTHFGLMLCLLYSCSLHAAEAMKFGVLNQHPVTVAAQIWNPMLLEISQQTGIPLALSMGQSAPETTQRTLAGEYDFAYTNHLFSPERQKIGFQVIARLNRPAIRGQIVVPIDSPLQKLADLNGKKIVFPSKEAFVGYHVPSQALSRAGISVSSAFAGNQEGAMRQLATGIVDAAAVNDRVMHAFAMRTKFRYRVLWRSEPYPDLAVMAHPRVPAGMVARVRDALLSMHQRDSGRRALENANRFLRSTEPLIFVPASNADYAPYSRFWREQAEQP